MTSLYRDSKSTASAFKEFKGIVGDQWASDSEESSQQYNDPFDPFELVSEGYVAFSSVKDEPRVNFFDLYHHLRNNSHKLWMSVPGPSWGSLIGNGLERSAAEDCYGNSAFIEGFKKSFGCEPEIKLVEVKQTVNNR